MMNNGKNWRWSLASYCLTFTLCCLIASVQTGPAHKRPRRMMRETDTMHQNDTNSIDTCVSEGNVVPKFFVNCEKKPGCRAIQKTGECCPEYQCECQKDGKVYGNGEKLIDPDTPCKVCYCQGGEISCSKVTCYTRNDCESKYIPGRCCPEYDNCPPLETVKSPSASNEVSSKELVSSASSDTQKIDNGVPVEENGNDILENNTTPQQELQQAPNDNPLGIKIKEITKVEEIRFTDEKRPMVPKIITQQQSPQQSSQTPQQQQQQQQQQQHTSKTLTLNSKSSTEDLHQNDIQPIIIPTSTVDSPKTTTKTQCSTEEPNKLEHIDTNLAVDDEDSLKNVRHAGDETNIVMTDYSIEIPDASVENKMNSSETNGAAEPEATTTENPEVSSSTISESPTTLSSSYKPTESSSSSTEIFHTSTKSTAEFIEDMQEEKQHEDKQLPSVVQIGDQLVIVDHRSQSKPISVIKVEAKGLRRGDDGDAEDNSNKEDDTDGNSSSSSSSSSSSPSAPTEVKATTTEEAITTIMMSTTPFPEMQNDDHGTLTVREVPMNEGKQQQPQDTNSNKNEAFDTIYHSGSGGDTMSEEVFETNHFTEGPNNDIKQTSYDFDHVASSSEEFIQVVSSSTSNGEDQTTRGNTNLTNPFEASGSGSGYGSGSGSGEAIDTEFFTSGPNDASGDAAENENVTNTDSDEYMSTEEPTTETDDRKTTATEISPTMASVAKTTKQSVAPEDVIPTAQKTYIEDDELPTHELISPGYAPIPEDFSLSRYPDQTPFNANDEDMESHRSSSTVNTQAKNKQNSKILSEVLDEKENETNSATETVSTSTDGTAASISWLKDKEELANLKDASAEGIISTTQVNQNLLNEVTSMDSSEVDVGSGSNETDLSESSENINHITEARFAPGEPFLVPEWERNNTSAEKDNLTKVISEDSESDEDNDVVGKDSEKSSEETTNATQISSNLKHNPKEDVESLKYENNEDSDTPVEYVRTIEETGKYDIVPAIRLSDY